MHLIPELGRETQVGPWGSLTSEPRLLGEFRSNEKNEVTGF